MIDKKGDTWIMREVTNLEPFKLPKNHVVCPDCDGKGKILFMYCDPGPNKYWKCITCLGEGHLDKDDLERWKNHAKKTCNSGKPLEK